MYHPTKIVVREEKGKNVIKCSTRCKSTCGNVIYIFCCVDIVVNVTKEKINLSVDYHLTSIEVREDKGENVITCNLQVFIIYDFFNKT